MVVYFGAASGPVPAFDTSILGANGSLSLARPTLKDYVQTKEEIQWRADEMFDLWQAGNLIIHQGGAYALAEAAEAHADLQGRRATGKLVLDTNPNY